MSYTLEVAQGVSTIEATEWNRHVDDYPFAQHAFLSALEHSGSVGKGTGWQAVPLLLKNNDQLIAVAPAYLKTHSWGEYVFDWAWSDAYQRSQLEYYPKLIIAIPFTPCTGPRIFSENPLPDEALLALARGIEQLCQQHNFSGAHLLFPDQDDAARWQQYNWVTRVGVQYHWFNHNYQHYDDFLARCSSRKRKDLRKERRQVVEQGFQFQTRNGHELSEADWDQFYHFYQTTYAKRSGHGGYLTKRFFKQIGNSMADNIVMVTATVEGTAVAGALNFRSDDTLFGRYWGCLAEFDKVHFETCYYQGIDYCIEHGLKKFDAGAQGEHKIQRGFEPIDTFSNHWLAHSQFHDAVANFVEEEAREMQHYKSQLAKKLPFKDVE